MRRSIVGETRVDLLHLLEDLRDAYPGSLEETILTELVANSLDSGARTVRLRADAAAATLAAVDDGRGMTRAELRRYHDLGATSKRRGRGIGFAGVGVKLGLLACDEVVTETLAELYSDQGFPERAAESHDCDSSRISAPALGSTRLTPSVREGNWTVSLP
jgi:hypothetical protein